MLECKAVDQSYGSQRILKGVSLTLAPGSVTVLMGRSGSGKSTLVRAMSMLERPTSGEVLLDGVEMSNREQGPIRSRPWPEVTVVFQQGFLWPHKTVHENISLPAKLRGLDLNGLHDLARELSIEHCLKRYPNEVSVGQRQRAALARSLLLQPRYLLLDELTSAQDIEQVSRILSLLLRYVKGGTGILAVTHHIGFARTLLANSTDPRFAFLDDGEVVEDGGSESFEQPKSARLAEFLSAIRLVS
jgi:ABC-type polar amino acid transport system ATPase subunit